MANFVLDNTPLPPLKSDAHPPVRPEIEVDAADINGLWAALGDVRGVLATEQPVNFVAPFTGAVSRTIPSKLADIVSVKDFAGVDPTGATDSSAAVAAAIAALPSSGGMVVFPAGIYKLNLTLTKSGVTLRGDGYGNVNTGLGGTKLTPANTSNPLIQIGDGTTSVRGVRVTNAMLVGDGANVTGDGISILGALDVALDNLALASFGRNNILIKSSATLPSSGIYMNALALAGARGGGAGGASIRAEYGAQWVTNVSIANSHINGWSLATSQAIYLDGVILWMTNTYVDIGGNGVGHVKMAKTGATNPGIIANACAFDNPAGATGATLDVSTFATKGSHLNSWINGVYNFTGSVVFSDGTVNMQALGRGAFIYQPAMLNPMVQGKLYMPVDDTDSATAIGISRSGAAGGGFETLSTGGGVRFSGVFQSFRAALAYSASMTPDASTGNIFEIIPTDANAFTINGPSKVVQGQLLTIRIKNSTAGALGAVTWNATYKMAAWTQPAAGFSRSITFYHDGTALYEVSRTPADVPN